MQPQENLWMQAEAPWWLSVVTLLLGALITGAVTWVLDKGRRDAERDMRKDDRLEAERTLQRERARSDVIALLVAAEQLRLDALDEYIKWKRRSGFRPPVSSRTTISKTTKAILQTR